MLEFLIENTATIIISAALFAIVALIIRSMLKRAKNGGCASCGDCAKCGLCNSGTHPPAKNQ